jgi:hypothetical protein
MPPKNLVQSGKFWMGVACGGSVNIDIMNSPKSTLKLDFVNSIRTGIFMKNLNWNLDLEFSY